MSERGWSFVKTILVFLAIGPLIGLVSFFIISAAIVPTAAPFLARITNFELLFLGLLFCHWVGAIPALAVGTIVALGQDRWSSFGLTHAAACGLAAGVLFALAWNYEARLPSRTASLYFAANVLTCLIATLICWRLTRRWRRPR